MIKNMSSGRLEGRLLSTVSRDLQNAKANGEAKGLPPVHLWKPPYCGEIDIRIARDGTWFHEGSPIGRVEMVQLFSSILKREGARYFLVTPVEKVGIVVEDAPLHAIDMEVEGCGDGQILTFQTKTVDQVVACAENSLRVSYQGDEPSPYVMVRAGLEARIDRKTFYRLVDLCCHHTVKEQSWFGVWSRGTFFPFIETEALE